MNGALHFKCATSAQGEAVEVGPEALKIDAGTVLCRLYYTSEERLEDAAQMVEDAFRIAQSAPDERSLILETVG